MRLTLRDDATESPTIVAFSLALFVLISLASMVTSAQPRVYEEACLRAAPFELAESAIAPGAPMREDKCCDDALAAVADSLLNFDFAAPNDVVVFGRDAVAARSFDARGPPGQVQEG